MQGGNRHTDVEKNVWTPRGEAGVGGIDWEFGIDMYTWLYLK